MVSPGSTNPNVTKVGDYIFRVCFIDPFQGTVMAKFTLNSLKKTRVAVLTDVRQDYSVGLAQFYKEYLTKNGGTVVASKVTVRATRISKRSSPRSKPPIPRYFCSRLLQ